MADFVDCSLKPTLALKPEKRANWLVKALAALRDGNVRVSDVYDIVGHPKFVNGVPDGVGKKMRRSLNTELSLFSDKQRQGLEKSEFYKKFALEDAPTRKTQSQDVDENKMDAMLARCRAFVRENETLWEQRKQELEDAEEQRRREEEEQRRAEEEAILRAEEEKKRAEEEAAEEKRRAEEERLAEEKRKEEPAIDAEAALAELEADLAKLEKGRDSSCSSSSSHSSVQRRKTAAKTAAAAIAAVAATVAAGGIRPAAGGTRQASDPISERSRDRSRSRSDRSRRAGGGRRHGWDDDHDSGRRARRGRSRDSRDNGGRKEKRRRSRERSRQRGAQEPAPSRQKSVQEPAVVAASGGSRRQEPASYDCWLPPKAINEPSRPPPVAEPTRRRFSESGRR